MFADIIVDVSVSALDKTYQYLVPPDMEDEISIGSRVEIPFGRGNRLISGFVLDLTKKPAFPVDRMKKIAGIRRGSITIESELLKVAAYIRDTYGSTMNDALKTVLPIKREIKSVETHWLIFAVDKERIEKAKEEFERKHYKAKLRLLEAMTEHGGELEGSIAAKRYRITKPVIDGLIAEGLIFRRSTRRYRNPVLPALEALSEKVVLNASQQNCVDCFCRDYDNGVRTTYLLHGITGSGKTEVYIRIMEHVLESGRQGILLIPEIALTHQTVTRFYQRFGKKVSILNSRMSEGERYDQYLRAKEGEISLIIGPRSALFLPFERLGLIIIDEEHENSYKSENTPKYHAREVAIYRAKLAGASVFLGSATPSIEAYRKAELGEYKLLEMKERAGAGTLPKVHVIDLREEMAAKNPSIFSRKLQEMIRERLKKGEQTMLFLNRRGFAGFVSCRSCGNVLKCPHCDVSYTAHKNHRGEVDSLVCHYCGHRIPMPEKCPKCSSPYIAGFGLGTQKVETLAARTFPEAKILRMDADTTKGKTGHENVLGAFRRGEADILIGTQMIVKGHDFPKVTLVGVIAADLTMFAGDYRSGERTFQLLMQASGRAGRDKLAGDVVIQTYDPEHYAIQAVCHQDYMEFYQNEMAYRRMLHYPPVWSIMAVLAFSKEEAAAKEAVEKIAGFVRQRETLWQKETEKEAAGLQCIGPTKANIGKINDWHRYVCYLKCETEDMLIKIRAELEEEIGRFINKNVVNIGFDLNPVNGY